MLIARMPNPALLLVWLLGCSGGTPGAQAPGVVPRAEAAPGSFTKTASESARVAPLDPEQALGSAEALHRDQLSVGGRDERFAVDRQVAELRKAIVLYRQFIDRAEGDPRYVEAVRRSQGRIDDAERTIEFLLGDAAEAK
jgi:hypothetical protein